MHIKSELLILSINGSKYSKNIQNLKKSKIPTKTKWWIIRVGVSNFIKFDLRCDPKRMCYSGTSIIRTSFIWHLDYPDMLNSTKCINTRAEGMTNDHLGVWPQLIKELGCCRGLPRPKPTALCTCMNAVDRDYTIQISFKD